jgi:hypothetical protein
MVATMQIAVNNPDQLRAILALQASGWDRQEICRAFRMGQTTFYRRLAVARAIEARGLDEPATRARNAG